MADGTRPVAVAANRLRPKAEGASRFAASPRVEGHVGVLEVAAEVLVDIEVALVDGRDERQVVHVFEDRAVRRVLDLAISVPIG